MPHVVRFSVAPVKGLALVHPEEVVLEPRGVPENRRFYLIEPRGNRLSAGRRAPLAGIRPDYDAERDVLTLRFPDGRVVEDRIELREPVTTKFGHGSVTGRVVHGPWADVLGREIGRTLRLVRADEPGASVAPQRAVSIVSRASVEALTLASDAPEPVDVRRFRMTIEIDGCGAHEEDEWVGSKVRIGDAVVRVLEPLDRCTFTEHDPETGVRDFPTLKAIKGYRGMSERKTIDFGIVGEVVRPGRVRVGDAVEPIV